MMLGRPCRNEEHLSAGWWDASPFAMGLACFGVGVVCLMSVCFCWFCAFVACFVCLFFY